MTRTLATSEMETANDTPKIGPEERSRDSTTRSVGMCREESASRIAGLCSCALRETVSPRVLATAKRRNVYVAFMTTVIINAAPYCKKRFTI